MKSIPYQMIKFEQEVRDAIEKRSAADFAEYKKRLVSENKRIYLIGRNEQSLELQNAIR